MTNAQIDIHFERVAKRINVKQLKTTIWDEITQPPSVRIFIPFVSSPSVILLIRILNTCSTTHRIHMFPP